MQRAINKFQKHQKDYGLKKHITQMNDLEKDFLMRKFHAVSKREWTFTGYSQERFDKRGIDPKHFLTLWRGDVELIEYHKKNGTNRILLRSKAIHKGSQVCAVFSIEDKAIITSYLNYHENKHEQLREEFYDKHLDVLQTYKGGK